MKKRLLYLAMAGLLAYTGVGCSSDDTTEVPSTEQVAETQTQETQISETQENTQTMPQTPSEADETEEEDNFIETAEITVTSDEPMDYYGWQISIDGLEEYTELAGDAYTDTPAEGDVYLVLYLKIKNSTGHADYFNYNSLTAQLDGNDTESTYLVNNPHQYSSLYTNLPEDEAIGGFLVWEAPTDWQELSVTYTGFESQDHVRPVIQVSRDDLSAPVDYDPLYYY